MSQVAFELAVQDVAGARVAADVGADRVELCTGLSTGGLTPSAALVRAAVATGVPVHVLVRPRTGGFTYDTAEAALLLAEVRDAVALGAAGVVVGALEASGPSGSYSLDARLTEAVRGAAAGVELTFHRSADLLLAGGADPGALVGHLHDLGVDRLLTSGGAPRAVDALDVLTALVGASAGRVQVMAGSGVRAVDAARLAATGVDALHASASATPAPVADAAGPAQTVWPDWHGRPATDHGAAAALARAVRALSDAG